LSSKLNFSSRKHNTENTPKMYYYVESLAYVFSFQEAGHDRGNFILSMSFSFQKMSPVIVLFLKWTVREKKKKIRHKTSINQ